MAEGKKSFVLYADLIHTVKRMPKGKQAELFMTILKYVNDENPEVNDQIVGLVWEPIKLQLKRDLQKWEKFRQKQSENGKRGGRPQEAEKTQKNPNNPSLFLESQKSLTVTVNDTVTVTDNVNVTIPEPPSATLEAKIIQDKLLSEILTDQLWCEERCMQYSLPDDNFKSLKKWLSDYARDSRGRNKAKSDVPEFKNHFMSWMNKQGLNDIKPDSATYKKTGNSYQDTCNSLGMPSN